MMNICWGLWLFFLLTIFDSGLCQHPRARRQTHSGLLPAEWFSVGTTAWLLCSECIGVLFWDRPENQTKVHKCLPLQLYRIYSGKSSKSVERSGNTENKQTRPFWSSPRVAEAFVLELNWATFGCFVRVWKIEICRFALGSALHVRERHEARKNFPEVSRREHRIREAASWIDL